MKKATRCPKCYRRFKNRHAGANCPDCHGTALVTAGTRSGFLVAIGVAILAIALRHVLREQVTVVDWLFEGGTATVDRLNIRRATLAVAILSVAVFVFYRFSCWIACRIATVFGRWRCAPRKRGMSRSSGGIRENEPDASRGLSTVASAVDSFARGQNTSLGVGSVRPPQMPRRCHVEALRDILKVFKHDAPELSRYGELGQSSTEFWRLPVEDRKRLIALGLLSPDNEIRSVASRLLCRIQPPVRDLGQLFQQISVTDKDEIKKALQPGVLRAFTSSERSRIARELRGAASRLRCLRFEDAFWIMLRASATESACWIRASDAEALGTSFPTQVFYHASGEKLADLLDTMRKSAWVLHVHNHPEFAGMITVDSASDADRAFAAHWITLRPELSAKIMFFVVTTDSVFQYTHNNSCKETWLRTSTGP